MVAWMRAPAIVLALAGILLLAWGIVWLNKNTGAEPATSVANAYLTELARLHTAGVLSDKEFLSAKDRIVTDGQAATPAPLQ